jgi:uncharacterized protein
MVPANRWGYGQFTAPQLRIIQEVITLVVFAIFSIAFLGDAIRWNHFPACLVGAVYFTFRW